MPMLDAKGEKILRHYVENGSQDQSAAWSHANPNSKAKPESVNQIASRWFAQVKVQSRLAELHAEVVERIKASVGELAVTIENSSEVLRKIRDAAFEQGKYSAAVAAEVKRGELHGLYISRSEVGDAGDFARMSTEELKEYVYGGIDDEERDTKH